MKLTIILTLISFYSFSQNECYQKAIKKYNFSQKYDSCNIRLSLNIWGDVTQDDIADYYQNWLPEEDFNCLVNAIKWKSEYPIILVVNRQKSKSNKKIVLVKEQVFDFDVFRALIYQK